MSRLFRSNEALVAVTIVVVSLVIGLNNPTFFSVGNLFDLLRSSIVMGIFAMGVLIVIISCSSVSDVVSGCIFTIPLMKKLVYGAVDSRANETMSVLNG